jgi:hypothetical protein
MLDPDITMRRNPLDHLRSLPLGATCDVTLQADRGFSRSFFGTGETPETVQTSLYRQEHIDPFGQYLAAGNLTQHRSNPDLLGWFNTGFVLFRNTRAARGILDASLEFFPLLDDPTFQAKSPIATQLFFDDQTAFSLLLATHYNVVEEEKADLHFSGSSNASLLKPQAVIARAALSRGECITLRKASRDFTWRQMLLSPYAPPGMLELYDKLPEQLTLWALHPGRFPLLTIEKHTRIPDLVGEAPYIMHYNYIDLKEYKDKEAVMKANRDWHII